MSTDAPGVTPMSFPTVRHKSELPTCCGRGVHARGTAGKGEGDIYACSACYRDIGIVNGSASAPMEFARWTNEAP